MLKLLLEGDAGRNDNTVGVAGILGIEEADGLRVQFWPSIGFLLALDCPSSSDSSSLSESSDSDADAASESPLD